MIGRLQNSTIPRDIGHRASRDQHTPHSFLALSLSNLPQGIKNLSSGNPRNHIHSKARRSSVRQFLDHLFVLRRVDERDDRSAILQLIHLAHSTVETRRADFKQDIALRPDRLALSQCYAGFLICLIGKLCFRSCSSLDQHALESFLQQQRCILRCDCHSSLVWICLADYTDREFGVWGRGNGRYGFGIGGQDGAVSSGDNCRDSRPQLLSVVPFLGWTVERADMASCELLDV